MADPVALFANLAQQGKKPRAIRIILIDRLAPITTRRHVIRRTRKFQPQRSRHAALPWQPMPSHYRMVASTGKKQDLTLSLGHRIVEHVGVEVQLLRVGGIADDAVVLDKAAHLGVVPAAAHVHQRKAVLSELTGSAAGPVRARLLLLGKPVAFQLGQADLEALLNNIANVFS